MHLRDIESDLAGLTRAEILTAIRAAARRKRQGGRLPPVMTMAYVAQLMGPEWPVHRVRRRMVRLGIARKTASRWEVTATALKHADSALWLELEMEAAGQ